MNLHGIANPIIQAINPNVPATYQASAGTTTNADGTRVPAYAAPVTVSAQVQPLSSGDLRQLSGINLNGSQRAIYLFGDANALSRVTNKGGDLITLTDGANAGVWLVVQELESYPNWTKVCATLQNGS